MKEYSDYYFRKAKQENYPARSVYKLKELDARFRLLRSSMKVLDLGAAPGSWSLYASERIGPSGLILACDIQEVSTPFPFQVSFHKEDVFKPSPEFNEIIKSSGPFDLVMSDMAPSTTGNKITDQARSLDLATRAFELALAELKKGGNFIVKIFMGPDIQNLLNPMRSAFSAVRTFKPKSSRSESRETFFVGLGLKPVIKDIKK